MQGVQGAPHRLRCEYLDDPLGIDVPRPRLSWCVGDARSAEVQTAYRILAASRSDLLQLDEGDFWDSGRVDDSATSQIEYNGKPLISGRRVWWKVCSYDSDGVPGPWSEPACFEAGLLRPDDWRGRWISSGLHGSPSLGAPVPLFGRHFVLAAPARIARLYVAALGQVVVQLNGSRLGTLEQAPNWVDYQRRVEYLTFDVGGHLREGPNALTILLADGCFAGDPGTGSRQQYGERAELLVQLNVVLDDGGWVQLGSDDSWRWRPSWILQSDPGRGESQGRREPGFDLTADPEALGWYPVSSGATAVERGLVLSAATPTAEAAASAQEGRQVRWQPDLGSLVWGFPEPMVGRARLAVRAQAGAEIRLRYGLELDADGALKVLGEDTFAAAGAESGETFESSFSLHGFQYVEACGDIYRQDGASLAAVPIRQSVSRCSTLVTDNARLNDLYDSVVAHLGRTRQSVGIAGIAPGDRLGRVATFGRSAGSLLTHLDAPALVLRWLRDMADAQFPGGEFPAVVPAPPGEESLCGEGGAGSSDAFVEVLWELYRHTGDRRTLRRHLPAVRRYLTGALDRSVGYVRDDLDADTTYPADVAATAWLYRTSRLAARIAGVLGNLRDVQDFESLAESVRGAFRRRFVTPDGRIIGDDVPVYALALACGLLEHPERLRAAQLVIGRCQALLGTRPADATLLRSVPFLLGVLTDLGRLDLAYRIALEGPFTLRSGAGGRDLAQLIAADLDRWLFATLTGFRLSADLSPAQNAYRHLLVQPRPPLGIGFDEVARGELPVRAAEGSLTTIHGRYESTWKIADHAFELEVVVPGNCTATVTLPDGSIHDVAAGSHGFEMPFSATLDGIPVLREVS